MLADDTAPAAFPSLDVEASQAEVPNSIALQVLAAQALRASHLKVNTIDLDPFVVQGPHPLLPGALHPWWTVRHIVVVA